MHGSSEYQQQDQASLRHETTEDMSKMYTTLYDNEDPHLHQEYVLHQQHILQQHQESQIFIDTGMSQPLSSWSQQEQYQESISNQHSPASPVSSCFSVSSSSSSGEESACLSPAGSILKMMDADEADELADLFNIRIEDLLTQNTTSPHAFRFPDAANCSLFAPQAQTQPMTAAALQFENNLVDAQQQRLQQQEQYIQYQQQLQQHQQQQQQHYRALHSQLGGVVVGGGGGGGGGAIRPQRSGSLSPIMSCAPYASSTYQGHPCMSPSASSSSSKPYYRSQPRSTPQSPTSTYVTSPSPSPCPSPMTPSVSYFSTESTTATPVSTAATAAPLNTTSTTTTISSVTTALPPTTTIELPNTEGMTVIKNEDGSIMVYNPETESMTFRCELCPEESFGRIHDLKRHQASKHQAVTWPCEFCKKSFARRDALLRHYTVKSTREDNIHPMAYETERLIQARAKAKMIC